MTILKHPPLHIQSKLPHVGTTIFTVMSALANEHKAVNLGQGFPDYPMDAQLTALVAEAMSQGYNQYAPMAGWLPLREAIAEKVHRLYGTNVHPDLEITITPGGTYAIYTALTTILQPGDEVIVLEPAYDSYIPNIEINGAVPVLVPLSLPGYRIDWQAVQAAVTPRTKAIILNSPHNPTGSILQQEDIRSLQQLVAAHDLFIISDEVYEHLVYDGQQHRSLLRYPDLYARSFVCFSFGKVYHCTGWKIGYCIAPPALMSEFRKVHQFNCFSCHTPAQVGLARFIREPDSYLQLSALMQQKRDYFMELMQQTRFTLLPSSGSYFICASYEHISAEGDMEFAMRLTREQGVATIPLSAFYRSPKDDGIIRFCFAKQATTLEKAVERLIKL